MPSPTPSILEDGPMGMVGPSSNGQLPFSLPFPCGKPYRTSLVPAGLRRSLQPVSCRAISKKPSWLPPQMKKGPLLVAGSAAPLPPMLPCASAAGPWGLDTGQSLTCPVSLSIVASKEAAAASHWLLRCSLDSSFGTIGGFLSPENQVQGQEV